MNVMTLAPPEIRRSVSLVANVSLDGVVEGPSGEGGFRHGGCAGRWRLATSLSPPIDICRINDESERYPDDFRLVAPGSRMVSKLPIGPFRAVLGQGILPRFDLSLGYGPICFEKVTKGLDAFANPLAASSLMSRS